MILNLKCTIPNQSVEIGHFLLSKFANNIPELNKVLLVSGFFSSVHCCFQENSKGLLLRISLVYFKKKKKKKQYEFVALKKVGGNK
jgi:hypothetical protein